MARDGSREEEVVMARDGSTEDEEVEMVRDGVWEEMVRQAWRDYVNTVNRDNQTKPLYLNHRLDNNKFIFYNLSMLLLFELSNAFSCYLRMINLSRSSFLV
jgi:hypothetical protein